MVTSGDTAALAVRDMVEASGRTVGREGSAGVVVCVDALMKAYHANPDVARKVYDLCCDLCEGEPIPGRLVSALCHVEFYLRRKQAGSLFTQPYRNTLAAVGAKRIEQKMNESAVYYGKGGVKVYAEGVINLLNHKRRNRIPSMFGEPESSQDELSEVNDG